MLDIKFMRENTARVQEMLRRRGSDLDTGLFIGADQKRREILQQLESKRSERNSHSEEIGRLKKAKQDVPEDRFRALKELSQNIKDLEDHLKEAEEQTRAFMLSVPNMPHESVPEGAGDQDNVTVRSWGDKPAFSFAPKEHFEIGENIGIIDFDTAAKITGARFCLMRGQGALLERALINFMLDIHTREHSYTEALPPFMVNRTAMIATGQLPKFEEDLFKIDGTDFFLIPTAEVPVTNIHRDETLSENDLPIQYTAYTPCFRSEAGSYGKDTRGLIRQHQFNKVELVKFTAPEASYDELEGLLSDAEEILKRLNLHYRIVNLCAGDLGFSAAKTFDIEVWLPGQGLYREISSCSNFESFQARRAGIRFRRKGAKKSEFVHTLNGSGLAVGRTLVAVLENYQQEDGSVLIPEALRPYMHGLEKIAP